MVKFTVLGSGSSGNASIIEYQDQALLIDAGFSGKELQRRLDAAGVDAGGITGVLVSHEHSDHVKGLRVFCKRQGGLTAYANSLTAERLHTKNHAPADLVIFNNGSAFTVGEFAVEPFSISHDAVDPVGFIVEIAGRRIGIATDLGHAGKMVPLKLHDCHILMIETNHDPILLRNSNRPMHLKSRIHGRRGHLSNEHGRNLIMATAGPTTRYLVAAHISEECNDLKLVDEHVTACVAELGLPELKWEIARQDRVSPTMVV